MTSERWRAARPFVVLGTGFVIVGGLVSAASGLAPSEHGSWAAAYLVLIAGVAQAALGLGQTHLAARAPSPRSRLAELLLWNAGNAAVLAGTLLGVVPVVDVGGALLVVALVVVVQQVRGERSGNRWWPLWSFRVLVLILLVSIPIGLVLARSRPG
jgi:hypothetical protein